MSYLGHTILAEGLRPSMDHMAAITSTPAPRDVTTLRSFLGLASWLSKFIPNYATVVDPLRRLLKMASQTSMDWPPEAEDSFQKLKTLLTHSSALAPFDLNLPMYVSTDASDYGLGAMLSQLNPDGTERVTVFASRVLTDAEKQYSTVEKEALACVFAVERWRTYLWGRGFTLRTDHQALSALLATKGINRAGLRIARWSARLLCYQYDVVHKAGHKNFVADCLSRMPVESQDHEQNAEPALLAEIDTVQGPIPLSLLEEQIECCP